MSAAIQLIRRRARKARAKGDYEFVHLAAHLFAIGEQILASQGDARIGVISDTSDTDTSDTEPVLKPSPTLDDLLAQLEELADTSDSLTLFQIVTGALARIDTELRKSESDDPLPSRTKIKEILAGDHRLLGGMVHHWLRPLSVLARERRWRYEEAGAGRPPAPAPGVDRPDQRLAFYWESDPKLPRFHRVRPPRDRSPLFDESGPEAARQKRFRMALCPLKGPFHPRFHVHPENHALFQANAADSMEGRAALHEHLQAICTAARQEEVHLVVFPELTIDPEALCHLSGLLQKARSRFPFGIAAGSFHVWNGGAPGDWNGPRPHNELVLLDHTGAPLAFHRKKGRFRIDSKYLSKPTPLFPGEPVDRKGLPLEIFEDIEYGSELQILDTSLGRLAFLICADAIAPEDRGYVPLIQSLRPDLLVIVAMSHETEPFDTFLDDMSRHWIGTAVVNAHCICQATARPSAPPPNLAACNLALVEPRNEKKGAPPICPPTRLEWRYDGSEPRCRYYQAGYKDWREVTGAPTPTGTSWLGGPEEKLGLVIDLGIQITAPKP